jgi:hypothetical protein
MIPIYQCSNNKVQLKKMEDHFILLLQTLHPYGLNAALESRGVRRLGFGNYHEQFDATHHPSAWWFSQNPRLPWKAPRPRRKKQRRHGISNPMKYNRTRQTQELNRVGGTADDVLRECGNSNNSAAAISSTLRRIPIRIACVVAKMALDRSLSKASTPFPSDLEIVPVRLELIVDVVRTRLSNLGKPFGDLAPRTAQPSEKVKSKSMFVHIPFRNRATEFMKLHKMVHAQALLAKLHPEVRPVVENTMFSWRYPKDNRPVRFQILNMLRTVRNTCAPAKM